MFDVRAASFDFSSNFFFTFYFSAPTFSIQKTKVPKVPTAPKVRMKPILTNLLCTFSFCRSRQFRRVMHTIWADNIDLLLVNELRKYVFVLNFSMWCLCFQLPFGFPTRRFLKTTYTIWVKQKICFWCWSGGVLFLGLNFC